MPHKPSFKHLAILSIFEFLTRKIAVKKSNFPNFCTKVLRHVKSDHFGPWSSYWTYLSTAGSCQGLGEVSPHGQCLPHCPSPYLIYKSCRFIGPQNFIFIPRNSIFVPSNPFLGALSQFSAPRWFRWNLRWRWLCSWFTWLFWRTQVSKESRPCWSKMGRYWRWLLFCYCLQDCLWG